MFQNFDPKERKAILIIFALLLGGALFFSGGDALLGPEDPFQQHSDRFGAPQRSGSPMESGSYESYF